MIWLELTFAASPHKAGRPTNTAFAPTARALKTSLPDLIPPSMYTSVFEPVSRTASKISPKASIYRRISIPLTWLYRIFDKAIRIDISSKKQELFSPLKLN